MNKNIMIAAGFGNEVKLVESGKCPICREVVDLSKIKDKISEKEFLISGICQKCQDKIWGKR